MEIKGIDVSAYQGTIDYKKTAGASIQFAILRITEKGNVTDVTFENNYKGFSANKVKVGVYKFSYAMNVSDAAAEAQNVVTVLNKRKLDFPVFYDMEWSQQKTLPKSVVTDIIKAFRSVIVKAGYQFGIYCNTDWYQNVLDQKNLPYDFWLASYPYNDTGEIVEHLRPSTGSGWQYSCKGKVNGISVDVDMDVFYKDYTAQKPASKPNPTPAPIPAPAPAPESVSQRAKMVAQMQSYLGLKEPYGDDIIINLYNSIKPAGSYKMSLTDPWCHATVSVSAYRSGCGDIIPITAYCPDGINWFKSKKRWQTRASGYIPYSGDIIYYDWDGDGLSDHVGVIEKLVGTLLTVIEGNISDSCARRVIDKSSSFIMGYGTPDYKTTVSVPPLQGNQANGSYIVKAGDTLYSIAKQYSTTIEKIVSDNKAQYPSISSNFILVGWNLVVSGQGAYVTWVGKCTADHSPVKNAVGTDQPALAEYPELSAGNLVDVIGTSISATGEAFYQILIAKKYTGFIQSKYIFKA